MSAPDGSARLGSVVCGHSIRPHSAAAARSPPGAAPVLLRRTCCRARANAVITGAKRRAGRDLRRADALATPLQLCLMTGPRAQELALASRGLHEAQPLCFVLAERAPCQRDVVRRSA